MKAVSSETAAEEGSIREISDREISRSSRRLGSWPSGASRNHGAAASAKMAVKKPSASSFWTQPMKASAEEISAASTKPVGETWLAARKRGCVK